MNDDFLLVTHGGAGAWARNLPARRLRSSEDVREAFELPAGRRRPRVWIARRANQLRPLAQQSRSRFSNHRLLLLEETGGAQRTFLNVVFRVVVAPGNGVHLLPVSEILDVLAAENPQDLFIGGVVDPASEVAVFYRGTLEPVVVPLSWFHRRNPSPRPDFGDFEVADSGLTVRFGEYEASTDLILYAHDPEYRRRAKERRLKQDDSFGASLRRLRLLRAVSREDFPGISAKQIARIERGEIRKPHRRTLETIARRLGVQVEEIASY